MSDPASSISLRILNVNEINETPRPVQIKVEAEEETLPISSTTSDLNETQVPDDLAIPNMPNDEQVETAVKIKEEVQPKNEPEDNNSNSSGEQPVVPDSTEDNQPTSTSSVSTARPCCRYGIKCYRRNALHREQESHPGDADYTIPDYPPPPKGTPQCPYGRGCYRRNPAHFQQFSHSGSPQQTSMLSWDRVIQKE